MAKRPKINRNLQITFKRNYSIGAADAESDDQYLESCFVDTGLLNDIRDCKNPKRILLGRTGSGKSALLKQLSMVETNLIMIEPETLSLSYISNSTILKFLDSIGVNLDLFFKLLWEHVLTVELIAKKYDIRNESSKRSFKEKIKQVLATDKSKELALRYIEEWGDNFWKTTENRVKEFTTKLEEHLNGKIGADVLGGAVSAGGDVKISEETKTLIKNRADKVVNEVQLKDLSNVRKLLAEDIFDDPQESYYIVIDRLDEGWVEESIRYRLIKALIETVRSFTRIRSVKIVLALRTDLFQRVIDKTRSSGFQQEKFESLCYRIKWSQDDLIKLIDMRINKLFKDKYTNSTIRLQDIMPTGVIKKGTFIEYMLDRTFSRPREIILFFNECIAKAHGARTLKRQNIIDAKMVYSQMRLKSLYDEWHADYPDLEKLISFVANAEYRKRNNERIQLRDFDSKKCEDHFTSTAIDNYDYLYPMVVDLFEERKNVEDLIKEVFSVLYQTGFLGIKNSTHQTTQWSFEDTSSIPASSISSDCIAYIHPTFWMGLGVFQRD